MSKFAGNKTNDLKIPKSVEDREAAEVLLAVYIAWTHDTPNMKSKLTKGLQNNANPELDSKTFQKLLKQSHLVPEVFATNDVDMAFMSAKEKTSTKLTFPMFLFAMFQLSEKKGHTVRDYLGNFQEFAMEGPVYANVSAETKKGCSANSGPAKFFYDKSTFTGAHKKGGPSTLDAGEGYRGNFSALVSRDAVQDDAVQRKKYGDVISRGGDNLKSTKDRDQQAFNFKPAGRQALEQSRASKNALKDALNTAVGDAVADAASSGARSSQTMRKAGGSGSGSGKTFDVKFPPRTSGQKNNTGGNTGGNNNNKPAAAANTGAGTAKRGPERFFYDKSTFTGSHRGKQEGEAVLGNK